MTFDLERAKKALQKNCICTDCMKYNLIEEAVTEIERLRVALINERNKYMYLRSDYLTHPLFTKGKQRAIEELKEEGLL